MHCVSCGAALPAKIDICRYCGLKNAVDLQALPRVNPGPESERNCPQCNVTLMQWTIEAVDRIVVDRCESCHGVFFDSSELELLLEQAVSRVDEVDYQRIVALTEVQEAPPSLSVRYVPCPQCKSLMNRRNFGSTSGVIIDACKGHGTWLDGGELRRLLLWAKAGGLLHNQRRVDERAAQAARDEANKKAQHAAEMRRNPPVAHSSATLTAILNFFSAGEDF